MAGKGLYGIFGERAEELGDVIVESVRDTHERHAVAQNTINPKSQLAYGGSIWAELPNNLCRAVRRAFLDASPQKYPRARYSVPVLNDCLLYVWRPRGGQSPDEASFFTSSLREDLFDGDGVREPTLFDVDDVETESADELAGILREAENEQRQVVLIAVTARSEGLHSIEWGQVQRGQDFQLEWIDRETLFASAPAARPMPVITHTFADGQPPAAIVKPRLEATQGK
jgi:hypothetical protein